MKPASTRRKPRAAAARSKASQPSRTVARSAAKGDIAPRLTADGIESFSVSEAVGAAQESKAFAIGDIMKRALLESPAAAARVARGDSRRSLAGRRRRAAQAAAAPRQRGARVASRDRGFGTRRGLARRRLSLPQPDVAQVLRGSQVPPAGRAAETAGVGQGDRRTGRDPVRGARCRRQGRHDQALHGAPEPARCPRGRAREAERSRARTVVLPALRRAPADGRRDRRSSTAPGTTGPASSA